MTAPRTVRDVLRDLAEHAETWCHGIEGPHLGSDECQRLQREAHAILDAPTEVEDVLEEAKRFIAAAERAGLMVGIHVHRVPRDLYVRLDSVNELLFRETGGARKVLLDTGRSQVSAHREHDEVVP